MKEKLEKLQTGDDTQAQASKSVCSANHDRATAVAQAFRRREDLVLQVNAVREEMQTLEDHYQEHLVSVRAEYRAMRDALDGEQERMLGELQAKKEYYKEQLAEANVVLDQAHQAQMEFYNGALGKKAAEPMDVDGRGRRAPSPATSESPQPSTPTSLPADAAKDSDNDGGVGVLPPVGTSPEDALSAANDIKDKKDKKDRERQEKKDKKDKDKKDKAAAAGAAPPINKKQFSKIPSSASGKHEESRRRTSKR